MYTIPLLKLAQHMKTDACFSWDINTNRYQVYMKNVFYKKPEDLNSTFYQPIKGTGTTIEDACNDYYRQARGMYLYHIISDLTEFVI
jgi:hypothetical protein